MDRQTEIKVRQREPGRKTEERQTQAKAMLKIAFTQASARAALG